MSPTILVIGSTGKTGRRITRLLAEAGHDVRGVSRGTSPRFDWEESATWPAALAGVEAAYISFVPDLAAPGAPATIGAFVQAAAEAGVRRLVLLSGRGESGARQCEEIVLGSPLEGTVLRASWFAQNFSEGHLLEPVLGGVVALPAGAVAEPFIDVDDIAEAAVAVLTQDGHAGRVHELTGPALLTFAEATAEISRASGREVAYVQISPEEFHEEMAAVVGADHATLLTNLLKETLDGRNASTTDGVQRVLGRPARDFGAFCAAAAGQGVWNA